MGRWSGYCKRLAQLGITGVFELRTFPLGALKDALGKVQGAHLHRLSFGIDERSVEPTHEAKSISNEETFASDLFDLPRVHSEISLGFLTRLVRD